MFILTFRSSFPSEHVYIFCIPCVILITLTNQNSIQEEIKNRLNSRNACYHSVQNLLFSSLLSKNIKIKIYRTVILSFVFCGCETWSLTLREECRVGMFKNRVLRRIMGLMGRSNMEWRKLHNEELNYCVSHTIFFG